MLLHGSECGPVPMDEYESSRRTPHVSQTAPSCCHGTPVLHRPGGQEETFPAYHGERIELELLVTDSLHMRLLLHHCTPSDVLSARYASSQNARSPINLAYLILIWSLK